MKKQYKIYIIAGLLIVAVIVAIVVLRKKPAIDSVVAVDAADQAAYDQLYSYLSGKIDKASLDTWLGDIAKDYYTGKRAENDGGRLINGQVTKTGALLSAFATSYVGYGYKFNSPETEVVNEAYAIFYSLKGQKNKL
jgi:hypothetical protein